MAETTKSTAKADKEQGKNGAYYLVNPAGGIHSCTKEHAKSRLRVAGWRMATEAEIAKLLKQTPVKKLKDGTPKYKGLGPIAPRWSPDPDAQITELD